MSIKDAYTTFATRIEPREAGKDTEIPVFEEESHGRGRGDRG